MRRWLSAASAAAREVADRPALWLPGALAWSVGFGWLALVAGVVRLPSVAELTFLGADVATSGLWPWNLVIGFALLAVIVAAAFALAALAEASLLRGPRLRMGDIGGVLAISLACAIPVAAVLLAVGAALPLVAQGEFNAPDRTTDPLVRTLLRVAPLLGAVLAAAVAGSAVHAAAVRAAMRGSSAGVALRRAPELVLARVAYLVLAAILLRVLWDPIGIRLGGDGFDLATVLLLVGFVAIWLCLVLAGGALHAWGSVTWTRLLAVGAGGAAADPQHLEHRPGS